MKTTVALAFVFALALGAFGPWLDRTVEADTPWAESGCRKLYGEAVAIERPDGSFACATKHGRAIKGSASALLGTRG